MHHRFPATAVLALALRARCDSRRAAQAARVRGSCERAVARGRQRFRAADWVARRDGRRPSPRRTVGPPKDACRPLRRDHWHADPVGTPSHDRTRRSCPCLHPPLAMARAARRIARRSATTLAAHWRRAGRPGSRGDARPARPGASRYRRRSDRLSHRGRPAVAQRMIEALNAGKLDVAVLWTSQNAGSLFGDADRRDRGVRPCVDRRRAGGLMPRRQ